MADGYCDHCSTSMADPIHNGTARKTPYGAIHCSDACQERMEHMMDLSDRENRQYFGMPGAPDYPANAGGA